MISNHSLSAIEAIDIVYLWVDGNDPVWRAKRSHAANRVNSTQRNDLALHGNVEGRYRDNDELRYSLRALQRFFPAHGHVYVVTDGQRPRWLRDSCHLTLVDHRDLIPQAGLPTFDSCHIESYIHRIPGLAERYFYLNDDVFFGAPVNLNDWFWDGGTYVSWSDDAHVLDGPMQADGTALENACRLSHQWLSANHQSCPPIDSYVPTFRTFAHSPRPMQKSVMWALEQLAAELFETVRSTVFRTWNKPTLVSDFVLRWSLAHGLARLRDYRHRYISSGAAGTHGELLDLQSTLGTLDFFCINDTTDDAHSNDPRLRQVRQVLQQLLPRPSNFETTAARQPSQKLAMA